ncbi:MAG: hypothetical protein GTO45_19195 [Candidatus Aminicenantes bacterium]|nr:hypothetical protein [Candidatus Aminicenantes bacterium]NIM80913.1 hypothetical protein [Candidatus Aminicenantes bacterium]NIN20301.1 hypothetical protein [Candidatus Aminicenantes bacterium]NIN44076.1 hypothetical protein [Candidatus Aminicenantes bacterium]NIN86888.1 hypothetical protein [Candidatus Aminicenantes bacterium]
MNAVFETIKQILDDARANAYRAVNFSMVQAYWNIGRVIVEEEHKVDYLPGTLFFPPY